MIGLVKTIVTKHIVALILALMVLTQIGIAQHSFVHFSDHGHYQQIDHHSYDNENEHARPLSNEEDEGRHRNGAEKLCQAYLVAKSFCESIASAAINLTKIDIPAHSYIAVQDQIKYSAQIPAYNPRAPPAYLI